MKLVAPLLLGVVMVFVSASVANSGENRLAFAGWYNLFPPTQNHLHPMYNHPVIEKKKGWHSVYSQTAKFDAMTNLPRSFSVAVARDPDFKTRFGRDAMKDLPVTPLEIRKRTAWVWKDQSRVVVLLSDDKAVLIERDGFSVPMPLVEYAKSLDYDRIEKALDQPPRTDFAPTLQTFSVFKKGGSVIGLYDWAGPAKTHETVGEKEDDRTRWTYSLKDGSNVIVTIAKGKIEAMKHRTADGKFVDLLK
jgi:hypothetical protein